MRNAKLQIGIVGLGEQAAVHATYLLQQRSHEVDIVAICGGHLQNKDRVHKRRQQLNLEHVPVYFLEQDAAFDDLSNISIMLERHPDLDCVAISTPHTLHYAQVKYCLQAGLDVLVDKPIATNYSDVRELIELADTQNRIMVVSNQRRYEDAYNCVKGIVQSGEVGKILAANCILSHQQAWLHDWRTNPILSGGGAIFSVGYHLIDTLVWILDDDVSEVNTYGLFRNNDPAIESYVDSLVHFRKGTNVSFTINHGAPRNAVYERMQLWTTDGNITTDRFKPQYDRESPKVTYQRIDGTIIPIDFSSAKSKKWAPTEDFINSTIHQEQSLISSGRLNMRTIQLIDAMYRSLSSKQRVAI